MDGSGTLVEMGSGILVEMGSGILVEMGPLLDDGSSSVEILPTSPIEAMQLLVFS